MTTLKRKKILTENKRSKETPKQSKGENEVKEEYQERLGNKLEWGSNNKSRLETRRREGATRRIKEHGSREVARVCASGGRREENDM